MNDEALLLNNQLCFSLYAGSREIIRRYTPYLSPYGLTYTQYVVLRVLWEEDHITVSELGRRLFLDSGTLTPLLKKLEAAKYIVRERSKDDERAVIISLTDAGEYLKASFFDLPLKMFCQLGLSQDEALQLKELLDKMSRNTAHPSI